MAVAIHIKYALSLNAHITFYSQVFEFIPRLQLQSWEEWAVDDYCSDTEENNDVDVDVDVEEIRAQRK